MGARSCMTMRCTIQEKVTGSKDGYGHSEPLEWQDKETDVPCYVWDSKGRTSRTRVGEQEQLTIDTRQMIIPKTTVIDVKDRISTITDRQETELYGLHYIDGISIRKDHKQLVLREFK